MGKHSAIRQALRLLGLTPDDLRRRDGVIINKVLGALHVHARQQKLEAERKERAERSAAMHIGAHVDSVLLEVAPPLPPSWKILRRALRRLPNSKHLVSRYVYGRYVLDFAYPNVKLGIRIGDDDSNDDGLRGKGWSVLRFEDEIVRLKLKLVVDVTRLIYARLRQARKVPT